MAFPDEYPWLPADSERWVPRPWHYGWNLYLPREASFQSDVRIDCCPHADCRVWLYTLDRWTVDLSMAAEANECAFERENEVRGYGWDTGLFGAKINQCGPRSGTYTLDRDQHGFSGSTDYGEFPIVYDYDFGPASAFDFEKSIDCEARWIRLQYSPRNLIRPSAGVRKPGTTWCCDPLSDDDGWAVELEGDSFDPQVPWSALQVGTATETYTCDGAPATYDSAFHAGLVKSHQIGEGVTSANVYVSADCDGIHLSVLLGAYSKLGQTAWGAFPAPPPNDDVSWTGSQYGDRYSVPHRSWSVSYSTRNHPDGERAGAIRRPDEPATLYHDGYHRAGDAKPGGGTWDSDSLAPACGYGYSARFGRTMTAAITSYQASWQPGPNSGV